MFSSFQTNSYKIQDLRTTYFRLEANQIHFENGHICQHWYGGEYELDFLIIDTDHLVTIHTNAFNESAFKNLLALTILAERNSVIVHDGALNGSFGEHISIEFSARSVCLPNGLFNSNSNKFYMIVFNVWPYENNLNEMFAGETFGGLLRLDISNVEMPQKAFRFLHASNFTAFRHLLMLRLVNCGIEVIDSQAFAEVGRSLE